MSNIINIRFDAKALGDCICWIPQIEEYRKITGKTVLVSTFFNELFYREYPDLIFVDPNNHIFNIEKVYIGVEVDGLNSPYALKEWRNKPLQQTPCELLNMPYKPIRPKISIPDINIPYENYICITEHTSRKSKYWNNPTGWQDVVDYCTLKGVKVVVCSKEPTTLRGVIDRTGDIPLSNRVALIHKAKVLIAPSTGLAWVAYATNTPCIMISGSTEDWHEFPNQYRIINKDVCHGCINNEKYNFNDKLDCPENKDYICSKSISSKMVIDKLSEILWNEDISVFDVDNIKDAKSIILTPENNTSTDKRWLEETEIIKKNTI